MKESQRSRSMLDEYFSSGLIFMFLVILFLLLTWKIISIFHFTFFTFVKKSFVEQAAWICIVIPLPLLPLALICFKSKIEETSHHPAKPCTELPREKLWNLGEDMLAEKAAREESHRRYLAWKQGLSS
jgi:hypothetical protein